MKSGMVVGLGTGSTAAFAVDRIGQLMKEGTLKDIIGVPTSIRTYEQAKSERGGRPRPACACASSLWGREPRTLRRRRRRSSSSSSSAGHTTTTPPPHRTSHAPRPPRPRPPAGLGIPLATLDEQPKLDVAIDGADEVDPKLDVVKGRGGALLREKVRRNAAGGR